MKFQFLLSRYVKTNIGSSYQPVRIFDDFAVMKRYVEKRNGEFASVAKYPNERTYTFDYLPSE